MELKQLNYFVRVAELGSYTRAALELDIAQPALSRQIRLLETEIGHAVFHRNGRGVTLTDAGKILLEHARGIAHQVSRAREDLGKVRGTPSGRVVLGLPPTLARVMTVALMRTFRRQFPAAQLSVTEGLTSALRDGLRSGRLDVAVLYNTKRDDALELRPLMQEPLYVVRAAGATRGQKKTTEPVKLAELAKLPLVIPSRPNALRLHVESVLAERSLTPFIAMEIDAISAILDLVAENAGVAVLSRAAVLSHPLARKLELAPIHLSKARALCADLSIALSAHRPMTRAQSELCSLLEKIAPAALKA